MSNSKARLTRLMAMAAMSLGNWGLANTAQRLGRSVAKATKAADDLAKVMPKLKRRWVPLDPGPRRRRPRHMSVNSRAQRRAGHYARRKRHVQVAQ